MGAGAAGLLFVPPLCDRVEDIALLAQHYLNYYARKYHKPVTTLAPDAVDKLKRYAWPGNIRELKNTIDRAVIMAEGDEITPRDLPDEITAGIPKGAAGESGDETDGLRVPFTADFREDRREFERR